MDTSDTDGFFPERRVLRARRRRALLDQPAEAAEGRSARTGSSFVLWVAVFLPMFVTPMVVGAVRSGWHGALPPAVLEASKFSVGLVLVACALCAAVALWRSFDSRGS
ncbi:MAG: hypothetical protein ABI859_13155 [Pseudomonadota bacterium]